MIPMPLKEASVGMYSGCDYLLSLKILFVYAIAFAMAIFNEMRPEELLFDEKHMRPHLKACLLDGQMRHFPCKKRFIKNRTRRVEELEVFCTCRQFEYGNMISCDECGEWFHQSCITS